MEGKGTIKESMQFRLLAEAKELVVQVDHKTLLDSIMALLGARSPPLFTQISCGDECQKTSIKLDFKSGQTGKTEVVEGDPLMTTDDAEESAVMKALKYIREDCHIEVLDFSSRVARSFGANNTYSCVNEAMGLVQCALCNFDMALAKSRELAVELERPEMKREMTGKFDDDGKIYDELAKYIWRMVKNLSVKALAARKKMKDLESERMKHHDKALKKAKDVASKCYSKKVVLPAKQLLDYVLCHFGLQKASYTNGPQRDGRVKAVAHFVVPEMEHLRLCGALGVKGRGDTSAKAEEAAAFEALKLIEKNFKCKIIDLNHSDRLEAENINRMLVAMLGETLGVGESVKEMWEQLVDEIEEQRERFAGQPGVEDKRTEQEKHVPAYQLFGEMIEKLVEDSDECFGACWGVFDRLKKIACHLRVIKEQS